MLLSKIRRAVLRCRWRCMNSHNETSMVNEFDIRRVSVGNYSYGGLYVLNFSENMNLRIGHYCSIASGVKFELCAEHNWRTISTFPFKVKCLKTERFEALSKGDIVVSDDVWIGQDAIILSGVKIGQGAVIAAGAVVNRDIPPYAIAGGVPAKVIRYRFDQELIEILLRIDYSKLTRKQIMAHINELYSEQVDASAVKWMPKR